MNAPSSRFHRIFPLSLSALALAACASAPSSKGSSEDIGEATAEITQVPAQVSCIDINVVGARTVDKTFDVVAGQSSVLALSQLPTGSDVFTGFAYPVPCAQVTAATTATWLSTPTSATIAAGAATNVQLVLRKNGQANVGVDFQDDDGGTADAAPPPPPPSFTVSASTLDFGNVTCGQSAPSQTEIVVNTSAQPITVLGSLSAGSTFALNPTSATIAPGASAAFTVVPGVVPVAPPSTQNPLSMLTFTAAGASQAVVQIHEQATGGLLQFNPPSITGSTSSTLVNSGNAPVSFTLTSSNSGVTVTPSSASIAPNGSIVIQVSRGIFTLGTATINVQPSAPLCGPTPVLTSN